MRDRRPVDELSIEDLEEILRVRRREERAKRFNNQVGAMDPLRGEEPPVEEMPSASPLRGRNSGSPSLPRYSAVVEPKQQRHRRSIQWRWLWDKTLLFIEVLALLGFLLIVARMSFTVRDLNEESRAMQATPTPIPTPMIGVVVLPGGHTPPDSLGRSEPPPIPTHLQSLVSKVTPLPVPTSGPEQAQRIVIPDIGVDAPVVEGDDWESLKKGAGHHLGSANPGERGNCVISAHNDIYGEIFRDLPEVQVGQEILVHTETQTYQYVVQQTRIIEPTEVSVMAPTRTPVLTLISCYPYRVDTHRIVVIAALQP